MAACDQRAPVLAVVGDRVTSEKQLQNNLQQTLRLMGRAECEEDCSRAVTLLYASSVAPFVSQSFWSHDEHCPDVVLNLEFRCSRQDLPLLCHALVAYLQDLCSLTDMHALTETLTFREEYTGQRLYDNGTQHRGDIALRFYDRVRNAIPWGQDHDDL